MAGKSADLAVKAFRAIRKGRPLIFDISKGENNMVKVKAGGIVLGGLAAYLLVSKGLNMVGGAVCNICESRKWKNYYKYGKEGNMVPPGYSMHTHENENGETVEVNDGKQPVKQPQEASKTSTGEALGRAVGEAITKMINDTFGTPKAAEGASEGDLEASEEQYTCPQDCDHCNMPKCSHEHLKNGGKITSWDDNGRPMSGHYPWDKGEELNWWVGVFGDTHSVVEDTGKDTQSTDGDKIVHMPIDSVLVNGKDPGDPDGSNHKDGDFDGDPQIVANLRMDPDLINKINEEVKRMNQPKEDQ